MTPQNLEDKIQQAGGNPATMLKDDPTGAYVFPMPDEHTNWRDEQEAWAKTAVLFDQSFHMSDVYFKGPDVNRLFSESGVNNFDAFGKNKAKQFVATNYAGQVIADAICFGVEDDQYSLVGTPAAANWVQFRASQGDYDVTVVRDEASPFNPGERLLFRFQIQGPNGLKIVEKAVGGPIDRIKFFNIGEFAIAGTTIRALNHTMTGVPGLEMTGLEMTGPVDDGPKVLAALQEAGAEFGLRLGGRYAYMSTPVESGWIPLPLPAVYTGDDMLPYRRWCMAEGFEAHMSLGGSFTSDNVEDYYVTPYDLGYGRVVNFDHEFVGKEALQAIADGPHKQKVWLIWNADDVAGVLASSLYGGSDRAKYLETPAGIYSISHYDQVLSGDRMVGFSTWNAYTVNHGQWVSLGMVDEADAQDGAEVTVIWGDEASIGKKNQVESHRQTPIRATLSTRPLVQS